MIGPVLTPFGRMAQNEERWRGYLRRIGSGDRQGLAQLYDETCSVIYGLALRIVDDPSVAACLVPFKKGFTVLVPLPILGMSLE